MASRRWPALLTRFRYCDANEKQSRDFKPIIVDETAHSDEEPDVIVQVYVKALFVKVFVLGAFSWGFMPGCFLLAWSGHARISFAVVVAKFGAIAAAQWMIYCEVEKRPTRLRYEPLETAKDDMAAWSGYPCIRMLLKFGITTVRKIGLFVVIVARFMEAVDPDTDALNPGNTKALMTKEDQRRFADRWSIVPFVGPYVARLGLPMTLAVGLALVTVWQIYVYCMKAWEDKQFFLKYRNHTDAKTWNTLFHLADMASLHILSPCFLRLYQEQRTPMAAAIGGDRYNSYICRVPEMVFQGWFSVSALALTIDHGAQDELSFCVFSIITSFATSVKCLYEMASIYRPWREHLMTPPWPEPWVPCKCLICMFAHVLGLTGILVRLVGVWLCDSHELSISTRMCF